MKLAPCVLAAISFGAGIALTGVVTELLHKEITIHDTASLNAQLLRLTSTSSDRLAKYETILESTSAVCAYSDTVDREEWQDLVNAYFTSSSKTPVKAVGFLKPLDGSSGDEFTIEHVSTGSEALTDTTRGISQSPTWKELLRRSRNLHQKVVFQWPLASARQEPSSIVAISPVYRHTPSGERFIGWTFLELDVVKALSQLHTSQSRQIGMQLELTGQTSRPITITEGSPGPAIRETPITPFGGQFRLVLRHGKNQGAFSDDWPLSIAIAGIALSLLASGLVWSLASTNRRAESLAAKMTYSLQQAEHESAKLALLAEHIESPVFVLNQHGTIEWVNGAYASLAGGTRDMVGGSVRYLTGRVFPEDTPQVLELAAASSTRCHITCRFRKRNGDEATMMLAAVPLVDETSRRLVCVITDMTRVLAREKELVNAREAAESVSRLKTEFLANLSHEIRTPMNGILGMTEILLDGELSTDQRECAETVLLCADQLLELIDDLLDFSKLETGKLELNRDLFCVSDALKECVKPFTKQAAAKRLTLNVDLPSKPIEVVGDEARVLQIVQHLLSNAMKFTESGAVSLTARSIDVAGTPFLEVSCADSGIGIALEKLPTIFDSFTQADGSMTRVHGGVGIGLAICKRLAERMGGDIGAISSLGKGTTFTVRIPLVMPVSPAGNLWTPPSQAA